MALGDADAALVLARAGLGDDEPVSALELVERLLGPGALRIVLPSALPGADGELVQHADGRVRVHVSGRLSPTRAAFAALHELAHWHLGRHGHDDATEALCDAIAAALACPWTAFCEAAREHGPRFDLLAEDFGVDPSCAALRYGEVMGAPLALISPARVRLRGEPWEWGEERTVRRLAKCRELPKGVQRVELAGTARVALVAG